jgi:hypothetical protein
MVKHYLIKLRSKISYSRAKNILVRLPLGSKLRIFLISTDIELIWKNRDGLYKAK